MVGDRRNDAADRVRVVAREERAAALIAIGHHAGRYPTSRRSSSNIPCVSAGQPPDPGAAGDGPSGGGAPRARRSAPASPRRPASSRPGNWRHSSRRWSPTTLGADARRPAAARLHHPRARSARARSGGSTRRPSRAPSGGSRSRRSGPTSPTRPSSSAGSRPRRSSSPDSNTRTSSRSTTTGASRAAPISCSACSPAGRPATRWSSAVRGR